MNESGRFQVFFDGDCPLCKREIDWLRRRERKERIEFIDIAGPGFQAADFGKSFDQLMAEIHGRTANGKWVIGVEVFRHLYTAAGFGPLVSITRWPVIRHGLDLGYKVFARYRTRLTGRCRGGQCRNDRPGHRPGSGGDELAQESR